MRATVDRPSLGIRERGGKAAPIDAENPNLSHYQCAGEIGAIGVKPAHMEDAAGDWTYRSSVRSHVACPAPAGTLP